MLKDRYDNVISTSSQTARDAYIEGVDCLLSANHGGEDAFNRAIEADDQFALAYVALARLLQILARSQEATAALAKACSLAPQTTAREQSHINALKLLIDGDGPGPGAYAAIITHLADYPRDAVIVQPCTGVFGLIGFSGLAGREAEQLAFMARLVPAYGDDWWFTSLYAFAQVEAGQTARAMKTVEQSLAINPRNAQAAHIRAHVYYEIGETAAGYRYIDDWRKAYAKQSPLHCHISWHVALWALECGNSDRAWQVINDDVIPGKAWGPPLNVLTDTASFLFRAELAGEPRRDDMWKDLSAFAQTVFPNPGIAFADVHAALAYSMAGQSEPLKKIIREKKGPAGDVVSAMAEGFSLYANQAWDDTIKYLAPIMSEHERIGGSRAQRDLIEFTLLGAYLRSGRSDEASRLLTMRRPAKVSSHPLAGL